MGRRNQGSGRSLPFPSVSATYLCTAPKKKKTQNQKRISSPKILLWEEIKLKKKSFLYKQALFLGYKKFHSATEGVGCLVHPYARTPTEKKPKTLHSHNAKIMPHKPGDVSILLSYFQIKSSQLLLSSTVSEPSGIRNNKSTTCFTKGETPSHPP